MMLSPITFKKLQKVLNEERCKDGGSNWKSGSVRTEKENKYNWRSWIEVCPFNLGGSYFNSNILFQLKHLMVKIPVLVGMELHGSKERGANKNEDNNKNNNDDCSKCWFSQIPSSFLFLGSIQQPYPFRLHCNDCSKRWCRFSQILSSFLFLSSIQQPYTFRLHS